MSRKIVLIGFISGFGGAQKSIIMVANGLARLGYKVTIISLKVNDVVYDIDDRVNYIFIPDSKGLKLTQQIKRFIKLKKLLSQIKPDIVLSFWLQPAIYSVVLSKIIGFKAIYSERSDPKSYNRFLGLQRNLFFKLIDGLVFQTQGAKSYFSKKVQGKSVVINNPVYIKYGEYDVPQKRNKKIVNVGRLHSQKNQFLLIDSFAKINHLFPDYILEIYGDGELKDELTKYIKDLKLENRIKLKGTTKKIYESIADSSLFVLSSDYEGMPNALMEAMALGIPCISTDSNPGGARELITNKENGIICPKGSIEDLANSMEYMLENPKAAELMGMKARNICITHSEDRVMKLWSNYIDNIIATH